MKETLRTRITVTSSTNGISRISWEIGGGGGLFTARSREYWIIIEAPPSPPPHLSSISSTGDTQEDWERLASGRKGEGVGEPNHTTARKTGPLQSILFGPPRPFLQQASGQIFKDETTWTIFPQPRMFALVEEFILLPTIVSPILWWWAPQMRMRMTQPTQVKRFLMI